MPDFGEARSFAGCPPIGVGRQDSSDPAGADVRSLAGSSVIDALPNRVMGGLAFFMLATLSIRKLESAVVIA